MRLPLALLIMTVIAGACSTSSSTPTDHDPVSSPPEPTSTPSSSDPIPRARVETPTPDELEETSRLAVQHENQLVTMLPDGSDPVRLGDDEHLDSQPTWSHDGEFIAWASTDPATGATSVAASRFDGSGAHRTNTIGPVSAIGWDASSTTIAYLAGVPTGQQLSVVDIVEPGAERVVDTGSPYWYTWAPDADEFLVHADGFRVDRLALDGSTVEITTDSADFQVPLWIDIERALLFAEHGDNGDSLISAGEQGEGRLRLLDYDGYLHLVANPDANRVAVHVTDRAPDVAEIVTAGLHPTDPAHSVARGRLQVVSVFGGSPVSVDRLPAVAFLWDSRGETLAYLVAISGGTDPWYEWRFFDSEGITVGPLHQLTGTFGRNYLPYFDQLAADVTFFSPEADRFVFAGRTLDGDEGVYVHTIGEPGSAERIADGEFATWSPGPAGGGARSVL